MSKQLLLGDEAIAQAALDAGLSGVYAYPGTPSTEITEYIQMAPITTERNIHNRWCANEKTAMEAALGMSFVLHADVHATDRPTALDCKNTSFILF